MIVNLITTVYNFLWGDLFTIPLPGGGSLGISLLILLLIPTGIYFTIRTRFLPIRLFPDTKYSATAGNYITIDHGNGFSTVYMHCSALKVSVGDTVTQGQTIGLMGTTGNSYGVHLHFAMIKNGTYVNPQSYL